MSRLNCKLCWLVSMTWLFANGIVAAQEDSLSVKNAAFEKWSDAGPADWDVSVGARNGNGSSSKVGKGDDGSLQLSGDVSTKAWNFLGQNVSVRAGDTLQLRFTAKATDVRREGNQFDNCYVGVFLKNRRGANAGQVITPVGSSEYTKVSQSFRVINGVTSAQIAIFLSKSGTLNVKNVALKKLQPADSFETLVADMDRNYSYFEHKGIDWKELSERYRERAEGATGADEFTDVITEMLAEMNDMHIWVMASSGKLRGRRQSKFRSSFDPNFDFDVIDEKLKMKKKIPLMGIVGKTEGGFGYVRITRLSGLNEKDVALMVSEIENLFDAPGIIVDLRRNGGGSEPIGAQIASMFADEQHVYAKHILRNGPNHSDFTDPMSRFIGPRAGETYTKPMVCLLGPGAVSSAEGFSMMMKALPHCTTIGQPTRGASGNPAPVQLPNGVDVWYSRWMSLTPDGEPTEDVGVTPEIEVEHTEVADVTFDKAIEVLKEKTK